ncbi:hypothetical protein CS379_04850 [Methylobacterium frigidaeris]|nr:hypothetical protein CS379_04850 [Methylobacterium frigidaeris]
MLFQKEVMIGGSDVDVPGSEGLSIAGVHDWERTAAVEDGRKHTGVAADVLHDEERRWRPRIEPSSEFLEGMDTAQ